ncbi:hypothetical protein [Sulfuricurvum sp.]|uniref:hypothetical protein n=1 Tax=Sulfuricurvum sp. TaxID=2025608 RepID=UPI003563CC6F
MAIENLNWLGEQPNLSAAMAYAKKQGYISRLANRLVYVHSSTGTIRVITKGTETILTPAVSGFTGQFEDAQGNTVMVANGIIVAIIPPVPPPPP